MSTLSQTDSTFVAPSLTDLRNDLQLIQKWIPENSQVLDLGCGHGELLHYLAMQKNTQGYGLEIGDAEIQSCIEKGVNVLQHDLNNGLTRFKDQSVDTVLMTQALQTVKRPDRLINEMLRIGKQAIITFPNFGFWRTRFYLLLKGKMPVSKMLPYQWYDTPNIHLCTFDDFESLCAELGVYIEERTVLDAKHRQRWWIKLLPNWFGQTAIYRICKTQ